MSAPVVIPSLDSISSRLRLKQLRLLVALADHGSLVKAAEQVALTQPGASKALQEIETTLGTALFLRTNRGLEPNAVGHCVIRYARLIQSDLRHLREEVIGILQGHGGRLSVGVIMGAVPILTEALAQLLADRTDVSVEIVEDNSRVLLELLDQGRLDVAICRTSVSAHPELYDCIHLQDEALAVVASIHHPLMQQAQLTLADLENDRWIVYSANMPMRLLLENEFRNAGLEFPRYLLETTSAFATLSLLHRDPSLVALLSTDVARFGAQHHMTGILPLKLNTQSEPYELVTRRDAALSPVARLLMQIFSDGKSAPQRSAESP